jgi:hypothetical protein
VNGDWSIDLRPFDYAQDDKDGATRKAGLLLVVCYPLLFSGALECGVWDGMEGVPPMDDCAVGRNRL